MKSKKTNILILGGGIGGFETYRSLAARLAGSSINKKITLIDKNGYFTFIPLLHEVATGTIGANHTTISLPELLKNTPHEFIQASVQSIDPEKKKVTTGKEIIAYDYCVVALGSTVNYFGIQGAEENALPVRTYTDALTLQKKIYDILTVSLTEPITINIIGGGFTGIEIAGQVHDSIKKFVKANKTGRPIQLNVIEGMKTILGPLPPKVQSTISAVLTKWRVKIYTGKLVARVNPDSIILEDGTIIHNSLAIWSGGVKNVAEPLLPGGYTEKGRIITTQYLTHPQSDSLYAVGDIALAKNSQGQPIPQLGEVAHKEGEYVAKHIVASIKGKTISPFTFSSKGMLIPLGSRFGAAVIGRFVFFGTLAWYLRRVVYLLFVPGWKNKWHIALDWTLRRKH